MLDRHLRQQQAALSVPADEQTMAADFDFVGLNRLRWREDAQLNFEVRSLLDGNRAETVIVESRGTRGFRYSPVDRARGQHVANAPAQFFPALSFSAAIFSWWTLRQIMLQIDRSENATRLSQVRSWGIQRNLAMLQRGRNGIVRQAKQLTTLFARKLLAGGYC